MMTDKHREAVVAYARAREKMKRAYQAWEIANLELQAAEAALAQTSSGDNA